MAKSKIIAIGDAPLAMGFQLAGLQNVVLTTSSEFQAALEAALANPEYGIIIANEKMLNEIDWRLRKKLDSLAFPVIVPVPDVSGESKEGDEIRGLIKRALGFDLGAKK